MTAAIVAGAAASSAITVVADKASSANAYFTGGAAICAILTFIGLPLWRAIRKATTQRSHQTTLICDMHEAMFGSPPRVEGGVVVTAAADGLKGEVANLKTSVAAITEQLNVGTPAQAQIVSKIDASIEATNRRLDSHDQQISEARRAAGEAAVLAAAHAERLEMLSARWWEWISDMQTRNEAHEAALHELGINVDPLPRPDTR